MSGICGIMNLKNKGPICEKTLLNMQNSMIHRGPDDEGIYINENIGFGFRGLKVVCMQNGEQPIFNEDKSIVMVCDGRIFNYKSLKERLRKKGHKFLTDTDAEVIIHLYEEYEWGFLDYIEGQFAFALYDKGNDRMILVRDHFGIAPLYYTFINDTLVFASEIKAILEYPGVNREVDLTGLDQILSLPGTVSPRTIFKNISGIPPGHFLLINNQTIKVNEYWDVNYPKIGECNYTGDEEYYLEKLEDLLLKSVEMRLEAEVSVGAYLSGGLDSSIVTGMIKKLDPNPRTVLSMTFEDEFFNEEYYQDIMSKFLGFEHLKIKFDTKQISDRLKKVIWHCECPLKETYNTACLSLSELANKHNLKVILTGEGADELFAGYPSYRFDIFRSKNNCKSRNVDDEERIIADNLWGIPDYFYEKDFYSFKQVKKRLFSSKLNEMYDKFDFTKFGLINKERIKNIHPLHIRSYLDLKLRAADHLISDHGDRMLMANSVEGRYPFLNKDFVEFVTIVPPDLKLNGYQEKYILKKLGYKYVPNEIVDREKFGFSAPGSSQLLQAGIEYIYDLLSYDTISKQGYFNPDEVELLKKKYSSPGFILNIPYEEDMLMPIITFGIFKEVFNIPDL